MRKTRAGELLKGAVPFIPLTPFGKITLSEVIGISHLIIIPLFVIGGILLFRWFENKGLKFEYLGWYFLSKI